MHCNTHTIIDGYLARRHRYFQFYQFPLAPKHSQSSIQSDEIQHTQSINDSKNKISDNKRCSSLQKNEKQFKMVYTANWEEQDGSTSQKNIQNIEINKIMGSFEIEMRNWMIQLGKQWLNDGLATQQEFEASKFQIRRMRKLAKKLNLLVNKYVNILQHRGQEYQNFEQTAQKYMKQCIQLIQLAEKFHTIPQISNTLYYLCRHSPIFRKQLQNHVNTKKTDIDLFILSDLFIFGIILTPQTQFIQQNIISHPFFKQKQQGQPLQLIQLHYFATYMPVLIDPQILNKKNRDKLMIFCIQFINDRIIREGLVGRYLLQMMNSLQEFRKQIIRVNGNKRDKKQDEIENEQKDEQYSEQKQRYFRNAHNFYKLAIFTIQCLQKLCDTIFLKTSMSTGLGSTIVGQLSGMIKYVGKNIIQQKNGYHNGNTDGQYCLQGDKILQIFLQYYCRCDEQQTTNEDKQKREVDNRILQQIYNSCQYYQQQQSSSQQESLYNYNELTQHTQVKNNQMILLQYIKCKKNRTITANRQKQPQYMYGYDTNVSQPKPDLTHDHQYLCTHVSLCSNQSQADYLAYVFLTEYNKHVNRVTITNYICNQLCSRNNISYIVRILKGISLIQHAQITSIIKEWYQCIPNNQHTQRNINICTELIKYNLLEAGLVLANILSGIHYSSAASYQNSNKEKYLSMLTYVPTLHQYLTICNHDGHYSQLDSNSNTNNNDSFVIGNEKVIWLEEINMHANNKYKELQDISSSLPTNYNHKATNHIFTNLTIPSIISTLQKLGRHIYLQRGLHTHILINQIIDSAYSHIRNRQLGYELEMINRFNSVVQYLRFGHHMKINRSRKGVVMLRRSGGGEYEYAYEDIMETLEKEEDGQEQEGSMKQQNEGQYKKFIDVEQINTEEKMSMKQRQMERNNDMMRNIRMLMNSIEKQSYLETHHYAVLVNRLVNNKEQVKEKVVKGVENRIICNIIQTDLQMAVNWSKFYAQIHINEVQNNKKCNQLSNVINFIKERLLFSTNIQKQQPKISDINLHFQFDPSGITKCICAMLQTPITSIFNHRVPIKTRIQQSTVNSLFQLVLQWKLHILQNKGLNNMLLQQQVMDILEIFHPFLLKGFKTTTQIVKILEQNKRKYEQALNKYQKIEEEWDNANKIESQTASNISTITDNHSIIGQQHHQKKTVKYREKQVRKKEQKTTKYKPKEKDTVKYRQKDKNDNKMKYKQKYEQKVTPKQRQYKYQQKNTNNLKMDDKIEGQALVFHNIYRILDLLQNQYEKSNKYCDSTQKKGSKDSLLDVLEKQFQILLPESVKQTEVAEKQSEKYKNAYQQKQVNNQQSFMDSYQERQMYNNCQYYPYEQYPQYYHNQQDYYQYYAQNPNNYYHQYYQEYQQTSDYHQQQTNHILQPLQPIVEPVQMRENENQEKKVEETKKVKKIISRNRKNKETSEKIVVITRA